MKSLFKKCFSCLQLPSSPSSSPSPSPPLSSQLSRDQPMCFYTATSSIRNLSRFSSNRRRNIHHVRILLLPNFTTMFHGKNISQQQQLLQQNNHRTNLDNNHNNNYRRNHNISHNINYNSRRYMTQQLLLPSMDHFHKSSTTHHQQYSNLVTPTTTTGRRGIVSATYFTGNNCMSFHHYTLPLQRNLLLNHHHHPQQRNMAFITGHAKTTKKNKKKRTAKAMDDNKVKKHKFKSDAEYQEYQRTMKLQQRENMSKKNAKHTKTKMSKTAMKKLRFDPSTTPNYPLGPNGLTDYIENEDGTTTIITPEQRNMDNRNTTFPPIEQEQIATTTTTDAAAAAVANNTNQQQRVVVPPAVVLPTGSPHAFVATIACQELNIDPRTTLFAVPDLYVRHDSKLQRSYTFEPYGPMFAISSSIASSTTTTTTTSKHNHHQHNLSKSDKPEVAFIGRSNVGKSSLINALMNRTLAITSKQPGRTQQAYYYGWIPSHVLSTFIPKDHQRSISTSTTSSHITPIPITAVNGFLVDLPGYGYAVGPDTAVETWQMATQEYLRQRRDMGTLKRVFVLQDARLQTPQQIDGEVLRWLEGEQIPHTVVLTKADDHHNPSMNKTSSTAGVIKHANLCCFRYYQLWSEAGARLPDEVGNESDSYDGEDNDDEEEDDDDDDQTEDNDTTDEWYDEKESENDTESLPVDHRSRHDEEDTEEEYVDTIMLSPVVHVTSAKKQTGLAELLSSIEMEFSSGPNE